MTLDLVCNILKDMACRPGDELLRRRCSLLGIDWKPVEQSALEVRRILRGKKT